MLYSTCFNQLLLLLMMHLCITTGSGTYHDKVSFWGYSFTGTNPIRFDIPSRCSIDKLKDLIKQVTLIGVPLMEFTNHNWLDDCSFDNQVMLSIQKI